MEIILMNKYFNINFIYKIWPIRLKNSTNKLSKLAKTLTFS